MFLRSAGGVEAGDMWIRPEWDKALVFLISFYRSWMVDF